MTTSETELQERVYNYFSELQVFDDEEINKNVDEVFNLIGKNFGNTEQLFVCGSLAKIFDEKLPESYELKDIDLVVKNPYYWRFLQANIFKINTKIEVQERRFILYFPKICIEIWDNFIHHPYFGKYKNSINYCYFDGTFTRPE